MNAPSIASSFIAGHPRTLATTVFDRYTVSRHASDAREGASNGCKAKPRRFAQKQSQHRQAQTHRYARNRDFVRRVRVDLEPATTIAAASNM